jgi:uncharacterized spore protein YtfJ
VSDETTKPAAQPAIDLTAALAQGSEQLNPVAERIFAAAQPGAVYSPPVQSGNYTVITASQVMSGGGFGSGMGFGPTRPGGAEETGAATTPAQAGGGGMGGGGGASGRPVAVIVIGPEGVQIKPIVDPTQIALAGITAWATMAGMFLRMRRRRRD